MSTTTRFLMKTCCNAINNSQSAFPVLLGNETNAWQKNATTKSYWVELNKKVKIKGSIRVLINLHAKLIFPLKSHTAQEIIFFVVPTTDLFQLQQVSTACTHQRLWCVPEQLWQCDHTLIIYTIKTSQGSVKEIL